jgi:TRAP-type C4-dicarboxylate transport system permease small subunit
MQSRNVTILLVVGIPAGLGVALFSFGLFVSGAWAASGGDMPAGSPATPAMQFSRYVVYAGVAGVVGGLVMAVASLFALIVRLLGKFKD